MVGYASGDELGLLLDLGFAAVGDLRVWLCVSEQAVDGNEGA